MIPNVRMGVCGPGALLDNQGEGECPILVVNPMSTWRWSSSRLNMGLGGPETMTALSHWLEMI